MTPTQAVAALCIALVAAPLPGDETETRPITIEVTVVAHEDGAALERVLVGVKSGGLVRADGMTNADGVAHLAVDVDKDTKSIELIHGFTNPTNIEPRDQFALVARLNELRARYHFEPAHSVQINDAESEYAISIRAWPAVSARGLLVRANGRPTDGNILGPRLSLPAIARTGRPFEAKGLRRGAACTLHARSGNAVVPIRIPKVSTMADVDLGRISVPDAHGAELDVKIVNLATRRALGQCLPGITLVSTDGQSVFTFRSWPPEDDREIGLRAGVGDYFSVPPGDYYVVPGFFTRSPHQCAVIDLVHNGVDISTSGIPRFTVSDAVAPNRFTIDAMAAYNAIKSAIAKFEDDS